MSVMFRLNPVVTNLYVKAEPDDSIFALVVRLENFGSFAFLFAFGCRVGKNANVPI